MPLVAGSGVAYSVVVIQMQWWQMQWWQFRCSGGSSGAVVAGASVIVQVHWWQFRCTGGSSGVVVASAVVAGAVMAGAVATHRAVAGEVTALQLCITAKAISGSSTCDKSLGKDRSAANKVCYNNCITEYDTY